MNKHLTALVMLIAIYTLNACGTVTGQLKDKADEEKLLKLGALDGQISIPEKYPSYRYRFLDKYQISHDWYGWNGCQYASKHNGDFYAATDIFEKDGHTWQTSSKPDKPFNIDRYTRPEWQMGPNSDGTYRTVKGFQPMCFETWQGTQHFLSISLNKRKLSIPNIYGLKDGTISHQTIGNNHWDIQKFDYQPYAVNSSGRLVESWVLPIADTGYTFIFELGANQDSLKYPEIHAKMQAIFKHLIESVKIEPIK